MIVLLEVIMNSTFDAVSLKTKIYISLVLDLCVILRRQININNNNTEASNWMWCAEDKNVPDSVDHKDSRTDSQDSTEQRVYLFPYKS